MKEMPRFGGKFSKVEDCCETTISREKLLWKIEPSVVKALKLKLIIFVPASFKSDDLVVAFGFFVAESKYIIVTVRTQPCTTMQCN
jgi:hypothetical protein